MIRIPVKLVLWSKWWKIEYWDIFAKTFLQKKNFGQILFSLEIYIFEEDFFLENSGSSIL